MSVRSNGSGDHLAANIANLGSTIGTGNFIWCGWRKPIALPAAAGFADLVTIATVEAPSSSGYLAAYISDDGSLLWADDPYSTESAADTGVNLSTGTWYFLVVQRSGTSITLRVFPDSTSTTPLGTATVTGAGEDLSAVDWIVMGQAFSGEWFDGEMESDRLVAGVTLTDAQARTESQSYDYVLGTGTILGNWRKKDIDADDDGLNDSSAGSNHLTNTGCIAGASTPGQLGAPATPTGTDSVTATDTLNALTGLIVAAES